MSFWLFFVCVFVVTVRIILWVFYLCSEPSQAEATAEHHVYSRIQPVPEKAHLRKVQDCGIGLAQLYEALQLCHFVRVHAAPSRPAHNSLHVGKPERETTTTVTACCFIYLSVNVFTCVTPSLTIESYYHQLINASVKRRSLTQGCRVPLRNLGGGDCSCAKWNSW